MICISTKKIDLLTTVHRRKGLVVERAIREASDLQLAKK